MTFRHLSTVHIQTFANVMCILLLNRKKGVQNIKGEPAPKRKKIKLKLDASDGEGRKKCKKCSCDIQSSADLVFIIFPHQI